MKNKNLEMQMKNILFVGPSTDGLKGGQATHMINVIHVFENDATFNVMPFYSSKGMENSQSMISKVLYLLRVIVSLFSALEDYQLVHINSSFDKKALLRDWLLICITVTKRKKVVVQFHGGKPEDVSWLRNRLIKKAFLYLWRKCQLIVLTKDQDMWLRENALKDNAMTRNFVAMPCEGAPSFNESEHFRFLYIGRIVEEKGLFHIVEAAKILDGVFPFVIDLYGMGKDEVKLKKYILDRGLENKVCFHGVTEGEEKLSVLKGSHAFLYPTYYPEGLPYSILEAMSYGLPVIACDEGSIATLLAEDCGVIIERKSSNALAEAMQMMYEQSDFRSNLAGNARDKIARFFSFDAMKSEFIHTWSRAFEN